MEKSNCLTLKTGWLLKHDPDNCGRDAHWEKGFDAEGAVAAEAPGRVHLYLPEAHGIVWYQLKFRQDLPAGGRKLLRFAFADYLSETYLNGKKLGEHRGCEDPFLYDVTDVLKKENLLCVRVAKPYSQDVDGYRFEEIPHRNCCKNDSIMPGTCLNTFGLGAVDLVRVPDAYIDDLFVNGNPETEKCEVELTVQNHSGAASLPLRADLFVKKTGEKLTGMSKTVSLKPGENKVKFTVAVPEMKLWSPEEPFLYRIAVSLGEQDAHTLAKNFGFRTFRVNENGWFELNGKRIFLRCSHTGNFFAGGNPQPLREEDWHQDFVKAKACGFNMVRFISGAAYPEQLDYCDELGLMVYEESYAGWLTQNGPRGEELFLEDILANVKRDRSHACLTIIGTLNETLPTDPYGDFVHHARKSLKAIRKIDPTRLILYSSGRFDGDAFCGSVCNPYSTEWECLWGAEDKKGEHHEQSPDVQAYWPYIGDIHLYPRVPLSEKNEKILRDLGNEGKKPVFISEFGLGSLFNASETLLSYKQRGIDPACEDMRKVARMDELFKRDLKRFGIDDLYPFPIDLLRESEKLHLRLRSLCFDLVRANPKVNGISVTGLLDHSICGEGLWHIDRTFKPGIAETMENGFAPLRWCLFVHRIHSYVGRPFRIEAVLANEDVLIPGKTYPIGFAITGEQGTVWRKNIELKVTEKMVRGFSVPVLDEEITLNVPEGRYELHAEVLDHAVATDGCLGFYLSDAKKTRTNVKKVYGAYLGEAAEAFLAANKIRLLPLEKAKADALILVGEVPEEERAAVWAKITPLAKAGARVLLLNRYTLVKDKDWGGWWPGRQKLDQSPKVHMSGDWLYHREYIAKRHPYFKDLPCGKIMDWDYYRQLVGGAEFVTENLPGDIAAACVFVGSINKDGYEGGFNLGTYRFGKGAFLLCTFDILPYLGTNPAADRLFCNILNTEAAKLG